MAKEPSFPEEAKVGDSTEGLNETLRDAVTAKQASEASKERSGHRTRAWVTGAAVGVGSAAIVAALLYANRSRRSSGGDGEDS